MHVFETLRDALQTIRTNRLRATLTMLSVAIGVFSIISVMTSLGALQNSIESGLSMLGANTFQVQKFPNNEGGGPGWHERFRNRRDITFEQGLAVVARTRNAKNIGLEAWHFGVDVQWKNIRTDPNISVAGETPEGLPTNQWEVEVGRGLAQSDIDMTRYVTVLGSELATKLFPPSVNPVGETVRMRGHRYTVIGVLKSQGGLFGSQDRHMIMPISTFFENFGRNRSIHIMVQARSREVYDAAMDEVIGILRAVRRVPPGEENDFSIFSNETMIRQFNDMTLYVRLGTIAVACVALVAAGVGIMNIMLVSVTERTREIGIRKAVGATSRSIIRQFLTESVIISALGGVLGIVAGLAAGNVLALALKIDGVVDVLWVVIGLAACLLIGVAFGTYPAWKAANLDPIEALRFE